VTTDLRTDSEVGSLRRQLRGPARVVAIVALMASLFAATGIWHSGPAGADPLSSCTTTTGEIVVVDFAPWGGNIDRGCAAKLSTGYNAMISAGFMPAGDESDGPAFICRIDDEPPPSEEACVDTPPASASWSYWHADAGQNVWTYSSQGAMSYEPPPGSVDAWTFGASNPNVKPPFPPSSVRASNPGPPVTTTTSPASPTTTTEGTTTSTSSRTTPPPPSSQTHTSTTSSSETQPTAATTATSEPRGAGGAKPPTSTPPSSSSTKSGIAASGRRPGPKIVNISESGTTSGTSAGSSVPFLIGAVAIVCLAGAGGFAAWRRRRTEAG
jgi:hypothetical protein